MTTHEFSSNKKYSPFSPSLLTGKKIALLRNVDVQPGDWPVVWGLYLDVDTQLQSAVVFVVFVVFVARVSGQCSMRADHERMKQCRKQVSGGLPIVPACPGPKYRHYRGCSGIIVLGTVYGSSNNGEKRFHLHYREQFYWCKAMSSALKRKAVVYSTGTIRRPKRL